MIALGSKARDRLSGLTGIVIGHARWLTGCETYWICPQELKDGKPVDASSFDENRIEVLAAPDPALLTEPKKAKDGGGPQQVTHRVY